MLDQVARPPGAARSRSTTYATTSARPRGRPGPRLRPDRRRLRAGRPARARRGRRPAPAQLPPRRGVAAGPRHRGRHRPPGRSRRARHAGRARRRVPSPSGGWLAVQLLLGGLPLITPTPAALPLDTGARGLALARPGGPRCGRRAGGRWSCARRTRLDHPTLPAARRGGPMIQLPRHHPARPARPGPAQRRLGRADRPGHRVGGARTDLLRGGDQLLRRDPAAEAPPRSHRAHPGASPEVPGLDPRRPRATWRSPSRRPCRRRPVERARHHPRVSQRYSALRGVVTFWSRERRRATSSR